MLAMRISFMNQIANLCERMGADVAAVREGIGSDSRIGFDFLFPGPGYGGSCFPKDVKALIMTAEECDYDFMLLKAVKAVNERQKEVLAEKLIKTLGTPDQEQPLTGRIIACWGLSFKLRTDDMRQAPSLTIIERLLPAGATYGHTILKPLRRHARCLENESTTVPTSTRCLTALMHLL